MKQFALFQSGRPIIMSASNTRKHSRTNWKRVDRLKDEEIDYSEIPQLGPNFFAAAVRWPGKKKQITLRLDPDVLAFFRKHGKAIKPLSTRSCGSMSRVASGALASCRIVSARALKLRTESHTNMYS